MFALRYRQTRLRGANHVDLATERDPGLLADESAPTTIEPRTADRHPARMGRRRYIREERTRQQALPQGDLGGHRQVAAVVATDHHGREPSGKPEEETGELGRQRHPQPGVDQVQTRFRHQRFQERHSQIMEQEGRAAAAAAAAHGHLAHATTR